MKRRGNKKQDFCQGELNINLANQKLNKNKKELDDMSHIGP